MKKILIALAAFSLLIHTGCGKDEEKPIAKSSQFKIVSYNILLGMQRDETPGKMYFTTWLKSRAPDVLAIQEANGFTVESLTKLAASYGHKHVLLSNESYGTAITSKHPIHVYEVEKMGLESSFQIVRIADYNIVNVHFRKNLVKRIGQADEVLAILSKMGDTKNWLIMGDFNSTSPLDADGYADGKFLARMLEQEPGNLASGHGPNLDNGQISYKLHQNFLDAGYLDAVRTMHNEFIPSCGTLMRYDFIYISPDLKSSIKDANRIKDDFTSKYSDHFPQEIIIH